MRALRGAATVFVSLAATFAIIRLMPSNPAQLLVDPLLGPEAVAAMAERLGLSDPIWTQFGKYIMQLARGDFGFSFRTGQPVGPTLFSKLGWTLLLLVFVQGVSVGIGVPVGMRAAIKQNRLFDKLSNTAVILGVSVFVPFLAFALLYFFSYKLKLFPTGGAFTPPMKHGAAFALDVARHAVLPTMTLAAGNTASIVLYTRNSAIDILREDYIRAAYAKGWHQGYVMRRHALKNTMIPTTTVISLNIGNMMGGAIMTETVFSWPGVGRLIYDSVSKQDYPMLQGAFLVLSITVVCLSVITDLAIMVMDPRITHQKDR